MDGDTGLCRLQRASESLLVSALNCPVGARRCEDDATQDESLSDLYTRYTRLQRLVHQKTVQLQVGV